MNYFLVHLGHYPYWLIDSINSIKKSDEQASIYLCGDSSEKINGVCNLKLENIISEMTLQAMNSQLWKNDPNPLWKTSLYRIFILLDMMNEIKSEDFVHFDSDVILFESFENAKKSINQKIKALHITRCNDTEVVFGYSYCNSYNKLFEIASYIKEAMYNNAVLQSLIYNHPNEMQILNGIQKKTNNCIIDLPILPNKDLEYIFDPSSYGQYLFGTHNGHPAGWYGDHHYIGKLIGQNKLFVQIKNKPTATIEENTSKIINLHIHSKKTGGINV